jgi:hypothetical protein
MTIGTVFSILDSSHRLLLGQDIKHPEEPEARSLGPIASPIGTDHLCHLYNLRFVKPRLVSKSIGATLPKPAQKRV